MDIFIKAVQLILSLSILIILHEFGHFFFARLFKTRVEKFYLFFNAGFSLFKYKKGETEYGIGWLPLGGYVKISGMIDESMDKAAMAKPPKPYEFRSKPAWQRLLIMLGGVLVNFVLALFIFWMTLYTWGDGYIPVSSAKFGLTYHEELKKIGLEDGDIITKIGDVETITIQDINTELLLSDSQIITVKRGDSILTKKMPEDFHQIIMAKKITEPIQYRFPTIVDRVLPESPAAIAGLQLGDSIVSINNITTPFFHDFTGNIKAFKDSSVTLGLYRDTSFMAIETKVTEQGTIGFYNHMKPDYIEIKTFKYGFWEALPKGIDKGFSILSNYIKSFKMVFTKEGAKQIGGFGAIGNMFPSMWNWEAFWANTAVLSLILAFMNVLPIPALDGGHVLFLLYEIITGRKPGDKFMEYATMTGIILLFSLLIFANVNDIVRAFN